MFGQLALHPCQDQAYSETERTNQFRRGFTMEKRFEMVKPVIYGVLMFVLVGIGIAVQILSRVGLSENYPFVVALAALVSGLMLGKHRLMCGPGTHQSYSQ